MAERLVKSSDYLLEKQENTGIKLLWVTTNAFSHKRCLAGTGKNNVYLDPKKTFTHKRCLAGTGSTPKLEIFAYATSQVRSAIERCFMGCYDTLLNTGTRTA